MSKPPLIAIVDDDELARDGIRELIQSLGYRTATFSLAEDFLQSSGITETTCVITDSQMPGRNGLELQEALRSKGYCTPVILITNSISPERIIAVTCRTLMQSLRAV